MCINPVSDVIKPFTGLLKFDNHLFYKAGFQFIIANFIESANLKVINTSRLDICVDFETFDDGSTAWDVMNNLVTNKWWRIGRTKYHLIAKQKRINDYQYLRFGSYASDISVYLYNKSLEMREVKQKNYILQKWEEVGLGEKRDVWRVEFSMSGNRAKIIHKQEGVIRYKESNDFLDENNLNQMFEMLHQKYFDFRENEGSTHKIRMKKINLFEKKATMYDLFIDRHDNESTRSDKIFINKMISVYDELRDINNEFEQEIKHILRTFTERKNLHEWAQKKYGTSELANEFLRRYDLEEKMKKERKNEQK